MSRMKESLLITILSLSCIVGNMLKTPVSTPSHLPEKPYKLIIPEDWTTEQFPIPIGFATEINFVGIEDIRFSPGWADPKSDEYWTYAFLFIIKFDS